MFDEGQGECAGGNKASTSVLQHIAVPASVGAQAGMLGADLYCDIYNYETADRSLRARLHTLLPGLYLTALVLLATLFIADGYDLPPALVGLLFGLSLSFLANDVRLHPGLSLASGLLLRVGILLAGARVTLEDVVDLGPLTLLYLILVVALTIGSACISAKLLRYRSSVGIVAGSAVAICGASAALAVAAVLGERRVDHAQLSLILVVLASLSATATFAYPIVAHLMDLSDLQAGFFLGGSIHDVAQALGAGYAYSDAAGRTATIVKLTRVAMLGPLLAVLGYVLARHEDGAKVSPMPWFVLGFIATVAANSFGVVPPAVGSVAGEVATLLVIASVIAAGIRAPVGHIRQLGLRPAIPMMGATAISAMLCLAFARYML